MPLDRRDWLWAMAWAAIPALVVLDLSLGAGHERATRSLMQAHVEAEAGQWRAAALRYEEAAGRDRTSARAAHDAAVAWLRAGDEERARGWRDEVLRRGGRLGSPRAAREFFAPTLRPVPR